MLAVANIFEQYVSNSLCAKGFMCSITFKVRCFDYLLFFR